MNDPRSVRRRFSARVLLAIGVALVVGAAGARAQSKPPEGMRVGRWVLAPYLDTIYEVDDNIFRRGESRNDGDPTNDPESDRLASQAFGTAAFLPFRHSMLEFGTEISRLDYDKNDFARNESTRLWADLAFNLNSKDRLVIREEFVRGFIEQQQIDAGGEIVFDGEPFNRNQWEIRLSREVPDQQGYLVRVRRSDATFEGDNPDVAFFDFRGFDTAFEYRHPLPGRRWLSAYHSTRDFNNYRANTPDEVGIPFRTESQRTYQLGLRGFVGGGHQNYFLLIGHGELELDNVTVNVENARFSGLVASAGWTARLASDSRFEARFDRRPLPSSFFTYYLSSNLRLSLDRRWMRFGKYGIEFQARRNEYDTQTFFERLDGSLDVLCGGRLRDDFRYDYEGFLEWMANTNVAFRVAARHGKRTSNCPGADYDANVIRTTIRIGWF